MLNSEWAPRCCVLILAMLAAFPASTAEIGQGFASVEAFIRSVPQGERLTGKPEDQGYGDLAGAGRRDWAGVVYAEAEQYRKTRRVVVLAQQPDGSYRVAAQGPEESTDGGTSHNGIDSVRAEQGSVFVSWSWHWHGCTGSSVQQIKLYKGQWRVVGAELQHANAIQTDEGYDTGDSATLSHNLLTGRATIHFSPRKGKPVTRELRLKPSVELLDDGFDSGAGSVAAFAEYAGC